MVAHSLKPWQQPIKLTWRRSGYGLYRQTQQLDDRLGARPPSICRHSVQHAATGRRALASIAAQEDASDPTGGDEAAAADALASLALAASSRAKSSWQTARMATLDSPGYLAMYERSTGLRCEACCSALVRGTVWANSLLSAFSLSQRW